MTTRLLLLLTVCTSSLLSQQLKPLSVDRLFQQPSLSGTSIGKVVWSPTGKNVAYLRTDPSSDEKELWVYDPSSKLASALVNAHEVLAGEQKFFDEERIARERMGQTGRGITDFFWSPDGKQIFLPLNGDVYVIDIGTRAVKQLTETPRPEFDPKISPDGNILAYVREGELYALALASMEETKLTSGATSKIKNGISEYIAQEEMDRHTGHWWSPDSKRIAYLQIDNTPVKEFGISKYLTPYVDEERQEYAKAGEANSRVKVGVVSAKGGKTTWMNVGSNNDVYIARVDWLPDAENVAVQVQSRNQDTLDLLACDVAYGAPHLLLRETDARWVNLHDDLTFLDDGEKFIWSSERDGFKHLYLYRTEGGDWAGHAELLNQITKGTWEIEKLVGVDEEHEVAYFTAMERSPVERHLYSVKFDGSGLKRLSLSSGTHEITLSPDRKSYIDKYSSLTRPPVIAHVTISKPTTSMFEENVVAELDNYALPTPSFLTIKSADKKYDLNAYIIKPSSLTPGKKYPVIMYQYNGPGEQIVVDKWGGVRMLWHRTMAERGYIVFAVDGRGTPGRGRNFLNSLHKRLGDVELQDQLAGVEYLRTLPYIDSTRMMIWGKSYGGFMTCMALFTTHAFKLGIAVAPVTEWRNYDTHYTERFLELPQENQEGYTLSSPIYFASGLSGKILLIHGVVDDNVHFQDSMILAEALQRANKQFDFMAYPKSTHTFAGRDVGRHWYNLMTRYIQDNL